MAKVKFFMGTANGEGILQLESAMNEWIAKENVEVKHTTMVVRDVSTSETRTLGAEIADQLFVGVIYTEK